jgi:hypothetical protein
VLAVRQAATLLLRLPPRPTNPDGTPLTLASLLLAAPPLRPCPMANTTRVNVWATRPASRRQQRDSAEVRPWEKAGGGGGDLPHFLARQLRRPLD